MLETTTAQHPIILLKLIPIHHPLDVLHYNVRYLLTITFYLTLSYTLLDPTNISITPTVLVKAFNEEGSFICCGFGIPRPTLTWYKNNVAITSSDKLSLSESTDTEHRYTISILTLTISSTAKSDEANYTCRGANNIPNNIGVPDRMTGQFLIECTNLTLCFLTVHSLIHLTVHLSIHPSIVHPSIYH